MMVNKISIEKYLDTILIFSGTNKKVHLMDVEEIKVQNVFVKY